MPPCGQGAERRKAKDRQRANRGRLAEGKEFAATWIHFHQSGCCCPAEMKMGKGGSVQSNGNKGARRAEVGKPDPERKQKAR